MSSLIAIHPALRGARLAATGRRLATAVALALCAMAASAPSGAQEHPGGFPSISFEPTLLDFGRMEQNQVRNAEITILNEGAAPLHIGNVTTSCGCTAAEPEKRKLGPGERTRIKVTFSSKEFQGAINKVIGITSDDPATPYVEVKVRAHVHVPLYIEPVTRQLGFGDRRPGETAEQTVLIRTEDVPALQVRPARYARELFDVDAAPAPDDPAAAVVTVRLRPDAPYGTIREVIRLETNVPDMPMVEVEAFGAIVKDLRVHPDQVNFRYVERGQALRYEVRVSSTVPDGSFKVTRAEIDLPQFQAQIEERVANRDFAVVITGRPLSTTDERAIEAEGRMQGTLRIFTDDSEQPEIPVKVTYLLKM